MTGRWPGRSALLAGTATVALLAGCAGAEDPPPPGGEVPHGFVAGAEETAEAQPRLVVADADSGAVRVLDLVTEEVVDAGRVEGLAGIEGDGRFAYLHTTGHAVHVIDGGTWMVDHGDHVHYYRAPVRTVGAIFGNQAPEVAGDAEVTAVSFGGTVRLLDRARLGEGSISEIGRIEQAEHRGTAVPSGEHVLVSVATPDRELADTVGVRTRAGDPVGTLAEKCPDLHGEAVMRRGVVLGCADGALLVRESGGAHTGEKIPYPRPVPADQRAWQFHHRPGSSTLAAPAGERGVWLLDVSARAWTLVEVGPTVAVTATGEGGPLLTLTADGVLHAIDPASGAETARAALLGAPPAVGGTAPVILADTSRAYVNDPSARVVHEIDYRDNLRVARTFTLDISPTHMVWTGR